jgi:molybdate transport system ATP-binding protein
MYIKIYKKLNNFNLDIEFSTDTKLLAIIGKSGSGKTTILRCIAGFEECEGSIRFDKEWIGLETQKRDFGIVFQNYALFNNMNVLKQLLFAKNDIQKAKYLLQLMELEGLQDRYPYELSGGEKQRVALARALMNEPKVLLLDEPFSALNYELKQKLYNELEIIKKEFDMQIILISHDIAEVHRLADEVIEINEGKIINRFKPGKLPIGKVVEKKEKEMIVECEGRIYRIIDS